MIPETRTVPQVPVPKDETFPPLAGSVGRVNPDGTLSHRPLVSARPPVVSPKIERRLVSPALANQWLQRLAPRRRDVDLDTVTHIAQDIAAGLWRDDVYGLVRDLDERLVEGRARLHGLILAERSLTLWVISNVPVADDLPFTANGPEDLRAVTEHVRVDVAAGLKSLYGLEYPRVVEAACQTIFTVCSGEIRGAPSPHALLQTYLLHRPDLDRYSTLFGRVRNRGWHAGVLAGVVSLAATAYPAQAEAYAQLVISTERRPGTGVSSVLGDLRDFLKSQDGRVSLKAPAMAWGGKLRPDTTAWVQEYLTMHGIKTVPMPALISGV